jgi:hypothetical protein
MTPRKLSWTFVAMFILFLSLYSQGAQLYREGQASLNSSQTKKLSHDVIKAHVKFTGRQFLIINNDKFDWTNVRFLVRSQRHSSDKNWPLAEFHHRLSRIKAGSVYTLAVPFMADPASVDARDTAAPPYSLEIRCDTPQGPSFWAGRWD